MSEEEGGRSVFEEVKSRVSLEKYFAEHLGRDLRMGGTNMMECICPWHQDRTPSLKIYLDEEHFHCFGSCNFGGSIIDAVMRNEAFDAPLDAVEWISNHYKLGLVNTSQHAKAFRERIEKVNKKFATAKAEMDDPNSKVAARARKMLADRGISEATREAFGLLVHKEDARLLIPIFERGNHLTGWSGRSLLDRMPCPNCKETVEAQDVFNRKAEAHNEADHNGSPAFCRQSPCVETAKTCPHCGQKTIPVMLAGQFPKYRDASGYQKKETLYNLPAARKALRGQREPAQQQPILVMEGFGDVWAAHQAGYPGALAYNGGSMAFAQATQVAELARSLGRWIGLVPDMDPTGRSNIHKNIDSLRKADATVDVRVLHGIDGYRRSDDKPCKDLGEVLQYHGDDLTAELLSSSWWGADEFKIREIVAGSWDNLQQIERITAVLADARHTIALDELVPILAAHWGTDEGVVRTFLHNSHSRGAQLMDSSRLISTITDAHRAAEIYLEDSFAISTDYEAINDCLPGGGFRLGQLSMVLGKCLAGDTRVDVASCGPYPSGLYRLDELYALFCSGEPIRVTAIDDVTLEPHTVEVGQVIQSGVKPVYLVETDFPGSSVKATTDHQFLTDQGWLKLSEIRDRLHTEAAPRLYRQTSRSRPAQLVSITKVTLSEEVMTYDLSVLGEATQRSFVANDLVVHNSGTGKAQPLDTPVLTSAGYRQMGELRIGDEVIDPMTGRTTEIVGVFPQGERPALQVTFSDGTSTIADEEHLWQVQQPGCPWKVRTTAEIAERMRRSNGYHNRYYVPLTQPVEFEVEGDRPVQPYLLGAMIGDGSLRSRGVRFTTADHEIIDRCTSELPIGISASHSTSLLTPYEWTFIKEKDAIGNVLRQQLNHLGLVGKRSEDKFVPQAYKYAPVEDRLELLRGLMDTDGSCSRTRSRHTGEYNSCVNEFCSTSERLAEDVAFLVRSLGGIARVKRSTFSYRSKKTGDLVQCRNRYRVHVSMPDHMNPFWVERKASRFSRTNPLRRSIKSIEPVGSTEMQCIKVASRDELYLTNDFITTHNTTLIANMIWQFLRSAQLPVIFFSLEQPKAQVYITLAQVALGLTSKDAEEMIKNRDERLAEVDELFERLTIIDNVPEGASAPTDMTPQRIAQLVHEVNLTRGGEPTKVVCVDHLGLIKADNTAPQSVKDSDAARSGYVMEEFFAICKQTQTFFMVLQQLPKEVPPGEEYGYDAGRGASQQTDFCDYIFCIWRPDQAKGLSEDEKTAYEGQYKFKLGKNRHGPNNVVAHLTFDHQKRRITTESAYGIPTAFMPSNGAVDLSAIETGAPPGLFEDANDGAEAPPSWFLS